MEDLRKTIEEAFEARAEINPGNVSEDLKEAIKDALALLDTGAIMIDGNLL